MPGTFQTAPGGKRETRVRRGPTAVARFDEPDIMAPFVLPLWYSDGSQAPKDKNTYLTVRT